MERGAPLFNVGVAGNFLLLRASLLDILSPKTFDSKRGNQGVTND